MYKCVIIYCAHSPRQNFYVQLTNTAKYSKIHLHARTRTHTLCEIQVRLCTVLCCKLYRAQPIEHFPARIHYMHVRRSKCISLHVFPFYSITDSRRIFRMNRAQHRRYTACFSLDSFMHSLPLSLSLSLSPKSQESPIYKWILSML